MATLQWDRAEDRRFEYGVDHGVLYVEKDTPGADDLDNVMKATGSGLEFYYPGISHAIDSDPADLPSSADHLKELNRANGITWEYGSLDPTTGAEKNSSSASRSSVMSISTGSYLTYALWFWCANNRVYDKIEVYWYDYSTFVGRSKLDGDKAVIPIVGSLVTSDTHRANRFRIVLSDRSQPIQSLYIGEEAEVPGGKNLWGNDSAFSLMSSTPSSTRSFEIPPVDISQNGITLSVNATPRPGSTATYTVRLLNKSGGQITYKTLSQEGARWHVSFPAQSNAVVSTVTIVKNGQQGVTSGASFRDIQLEYGTTHTEYEAYIREGGCSIDGQPEGDIAQWEEYFEVYEEERKAIVDGPNPDIPESYYRYGGKIYHGVAWNGLTGVTESPDGAEPTDLWADNIKYASMRSAESFGATIEAYTSPKEFGVCDGSAEPVAGLRLGQQKRKPFGFAYRSRTETEDGYKIHLIYNATASPSEKSYETINDSPDAITFSWEVTTTPIVVSGMRPVSTITVDPEKYWGVPVSESVPEDPGTGFYPDGINDPIHVLEAMLFGTSQSAPFLPSPEFVKTVLDGNRPLCLRQLAETPVDTDEPIEVDTSD